MNPIILEGKELGLGVVRSLGMMNINSILIYCSKDEIARASKYVSKVYKAPPWSNGEAVKNFLISLSNQIKTGLLIPTNDLQVEILSKYKKELSKYYIVPVPNYNIVKLFLDKKETYRIAKKAGIDLPITYYPTSEREAIKNARNMKFPIIIKPRTRDEFLSVFDKKLFIVHNKKELKSKLRLCFEQNLKIMITEIIPGTDNQLYEYDFYVDKSGKITAELGHIKVRQAPPNFGIGRVIKISYNKKVEELTKKFLKYIPGFFGPGQLEFKFDKRDEKYKLIEMNGRITQQNELYSKAGINFAYLYYQEWVNNKSIKLYNNIEDYYYINLFYDLIYSIFNKNKENYSFIEYVKPYFKKHTYGIESYNDPKPMLLYWSQKAKSLPELIRKMKYR